MWQKQSVDGLSIRYAEEGEGRPVILLHGASLGSSADVWLRNLGPLASHRLRVLAPDLPGFGESDNPADHSVAYRKRFVLAFMDALGLERAALVGHSQSGRVAVDLGFSHPQRISKVIVLGTGSLLPQIAETKEAEGDEGTASEPTLADTRRDLEANLHHPELVTRDVLETRHRMSLGKNFQAFLARKRAGGNKGRKAEPLSECPVPLLLLYGEQDRAQAARRGALLKEKHPALDVRLLPKCRHLVQWDAADEFARLAGRFLSA
jgi:pimeloyl-ACP methyl ester carboxylesterase